MAQVEFKNKIEKKLKKFIRAANSAKGYSVGFYADSVYSDGTNIAQVAAWNEFGTKHIPERPFFRLANKNFEKKAVDKITKSIKKEDNYVLDNQKMKKIAIYHAVFIRKEIRELKEPPNNPLTIKAKKGKSNPLIDSGEMRRSVSYEILK